MCFCCLWRSPAPLWRRTAGRSRTSEKCITRTGARTAGRTTSMIVTARVPWTTNRTTTSATRCVHVLCSVLPHWYDAIEGHQFIKIDSINSAATWAQNITCPSPFQDAEESCVKPPSYSRPAYPLFEQEECERNHQDVGGCELVGPLWMPKCKSGYHGVISECVVSCPPNYEDHVISCLKPHVERQTRPHDCQPGTTPESAGSDFCYAGARQLEPLSETCIIDASLRIYLRSICTLIFARSL